MKSAEPTKPHRKSGMWGTHRVFTGEEAMIPSHGPGCSWWLIIQRGSRGPRKLESSGGE
jgi:hypothetical protein